MATININFLQSKRGLTLVELVLALSISSIVLAAIYSVFSMRWVAQDRIDDLFEFQGFVQETIGPQQPALSPVLGVIEVGQHDDFHLRIAGFDFFEQRDTAAAGHPNIKNDDIKRVTGQQLQCRIIIFGFMNLAHIE